MTYVGAAICVRDRGISGGPKSMLDQAGNCPMMNRKIGILGNVAWYDTSSAARRTT